MIRYERLGRVDLNVTDLDRSGRFYEEIVGLQRAGKQGVDGSLEFLCGADNCRGVLHESAMPGFRSMALALESERAFETLRDRLEERGVACEAVPDNECLNREWLRSSRVREANTTVSLYFLDPDGLTLEYSFGMEEFPETEPRAPRTLPPRPESIDSWGGRPDPKLAAVGGVQPWRRGTPDSI